MLILMPPESDYAFSASCPKVRATPFIKLCLILFFAYILLFSSLAFADCNFNSSVSLNELSKLETIEKIDIRFIKQRKWFMQGIRILKGVALHSNTISDKYKKKFKTILTITYPFGICTYDAKVKQNGDWLDHISYNQETKSLVRSLDVKLKTGNLAHITQFKFFLPKTRQGSNEIIFTELLQSLGHIAPTTRFIPIKQGLPNTHNIMLVQEKISKEMLEKQKRHESSFFEGDEKFIWKYRNKGRFYQNKTLDSLALARLINAKWANQGEHATYISQIGLTQLQKIYMEKKGKKGDQLFITTLPADAIAEKRNSQFDILLAIHAIHGLAFHNRQYFLNRFTQNIEPVYYDGNVYFEKQKPAYYGNNAFFTTVTVADISELITKIDQIIASDFSQRVAKLVTLDGKDQKYVSNALADIRYNLNMLLESKKNHQIQKREKIPLQELKVKYKDDLFRKLPDAKTFEFIATDSENSHHKVEICTAKECFIDKIEQTKFIKILQSQQPDTEPALVYIGSKSSSEPKDSRETYLPELNLVISHSINAEIIYREKKLQLIQSRYDDWFFIKNSTLKDLQIEFHGIAPNIEQINILKKLQRFNKRGLTGCLNFYQVTFANSQISATNGGCEDSVNLANSQGTLAKITISNAYADAIDADFSTLNFAQLNINNAGNDCIDLSGGDYKITLAELQKCGDKGISVGEASTLNGNQLTINHSLIAVASKDSSIVTLNDLQAENSETCLEAFNKKQEFHGAILKIGKISCQGKYFADENSQIHRDEKI